jgi:hypothetical protein
LLFCYQQLKNIVVQTFNNTQSFLVACLLFWVTETKKNQLEKAFKKLSNNFLKFNRKKNHFIYLPKNSDNPNKLFCIIKPHTISAFLLQWCCVHRSHTEKAFCTSNRTPHRWRTITPFLVYCSIIKTKVLFLLSSNKFNFLYVFSFCWSSVLLINRNK